MSQRQEQSRRCISCGVNIVQAGSTRFKCPDCDYVLDRCRKCRKQSNLYKCPDCEFIGP